jgi:hypothetical protein
MADKKDELEKMQQKGRDVYTHITAVNVLGTS